MMGSKGPFTVSAALARQRWMAKAFRKLSRIAASWSKTQKQAA